MCNMGSRCHLNKIPTERSIPQASYPFSFDRGKQGPCTVLYHEVCTQFQLSEKQVTLHFKNHLFIRGTHLHWYHLTMKDKCTLKSFRIARQSREEFLNVFFFFG